jgi:hypothetical protein
MAKNTVGCVECVLTHQQVAEILTERGYPVTSKIVWHLERQAFRRIASDPLIREMAAELGLVEDSIADEE